MTTAKTVRRTRSAPIPVQIQAARRSALGSTFMLPPFTRDSGLSDAQRCYAFVQRMAAKLRPRVILPLYVSGTAARAF
jgi:hypothetical protein